MSNHFQVAIVGGGPAGLSAGARAAERNISHRVFEKSELGNTIFEYQLRKHVMDEPAKLPLRSPLPFEASSREEVLERWKQTSDSLGVRIKKEEVLKIAKNGSVFEIRTAKETYTADYVILANGVQGSPRKIGVPGEDLPHVGYTLADPEAIKSEDVLVVGAGDAAIENAIALSKQNRVSLVNRSQEFPRAKNANVALIQNAIKSGKIRCYYGATIKNIEKDQVELATPDGIVKARASRIIARLGAIPPRAFLESCGITLPKDDPQAVPVVNEFYESEISGLFLIGSLIGYPLIKQAINQGFEVIEYISGTPVEPADEPLVAERLQSLEGSTNEKLNNIRDAVPLFQTLSAPQFRELIIDSTITHFNSEEKLIGVNEYEDSLFAVLQGSVNVKETEERTFQISQGEFFGEIALLSGRRHNASVLAGENGAIVIEMPRKQILKLMNSVKSFRDLVDRSFVNRLFGSTFLQDVPPDLVAKLAERAENKRFKKGDIIFKEGDKGDLMYVIRKGSVKVSRMNIQGIDVAQTYLAAGNFFGELALLTPIAERTATVTAAVACELLTVSKPDFGFVLGKFPKAHARIVQTAEERRLQNLGGTQDTFQGKLLDFLLKEGVSDADNVLIIDSTLCIGCDNCEKACAATHGGYSRLDRKGGKSFASIQVPVSCRHCENPLCMLDCPPDALVRRPDGEVLIKDSCIGCGNCVSNCPYGVIQLIHDQKSPLQRFMELLGFHRDEGPAKAAKCDLCESLKGGPACVRSCPTGAAIRVNPKQLANLVSDTKRK